MNIRQKGREKSRTTDQSREKKGVGASVYEKEKKEKIASIKGKGVRRKKGPGESGLTEVVKFGTEKRGRFDETASIHKKISYPGGES